jgi:hypothetical protein
MKNSPIYVFSLIQNCIQFNKTLSDIKLDELVFFKRWDNLKEFYKKQYVRMYNDIENNLYTIKHLKIYCLHEILIKNLLNVQEINKDSIKHVTNQFTTVQFKKDKEIIVETNRFLGLKSLNDYFKVNIDGDTYCHKLIKKCQISLLFWIRYDRLFNINNTKHEESTEHIRFRRIVDKIKQILIEKE